MASNCVTDLREYPMNTYVLYLQKQVIKLVGWSTFTCIGENDAELVGGGRAVSPQPFLLIPEVVAGGEADNTLWETFPNFKGKIYFLRGYCHILVQ